MQPLGATQQNATQALAATTAIDPLQLFASLSNCKLEMQANPDTGAMEWVMKGATSNPDLAATAMAAQSARQRDVEKPSQADEEGASFPYYPQNEDSDSDVSHALTSTCVFADPPRSCFWCILVDWCSQAFPIRLTSARTSMTPRQSNSINLRNFRKK